MKKWALVFVLASLSLTGCNKGKVDAKNQKQAFSYSLGHNIAKNFQAQKMEKEIDVDAFAAGLRDTLGNKKLQVTEEEMRTAMRKRLEESAKEREDRSAKSKKQGEDFLAANKKVDGVKETASGLQYKVIKEGAGKDKPKETSTVKVHYVGKLVNGEVFDSSRERNQPAEFPLNGVIKGWTEGLQLMKKGAVYEFYIPSDLAYGAPGRGAKIPPHAALVFEVELLDIKK